MTDRIWLCNFMGRLQPGALPARSRGLVDLRDETDVVREGAHGAAALGQVGGCRAQRAVLLHCPYRWTIASGTHPDPVYLGRLRVHDRKTDAIDG